MKSFCDYYSGLAVAAVVWAAASTSSAQQTPAFYAPALPPNALQAGCPPLATPLSSVIPIHWFQQASPPSLTDVNCLTYAYGPATDTNEVIVSDFTNQNSSGGLWPRVWVNRAHMPPHTPPYPPLPPNPIAEGGKILDNQNPPQPIAQDFSTVDIADAVTKAEILHMLGAVISVWQAPLIARGLTMSYYPADPNGSLVSFVDLSNHPGSYFQNFVNGPNSYDGKQYALIDKMLVHDELDGGNRWTFSKHTPPFPTGVSLDYEVHDYRDSTTATNFLLDIAQAVHGQEFGPNGINPQIYLYTNPWTSWTHPNGGEVFANGFDMTKMDLIKSSFDYISLYLLDSSNNCTGQGSQGSIDQAFNSSVIFLGGPSGAINYSKQIIVTVDEGRCTPVQALDIYNLNSTYSFAGYEFFAGRSSRGGQSYMSGQTNGPLSNDNQIIWNLLYGTTINPPAPPY